MKRHARAAAAVGKTRASKSTTVRCTRRPSRDRERGSVSSWLITGAFVMVLGVGIAVDLTGQVHAQTRLMNVAGEAARTSGQELDREAAITWLPPDRQASD